MASANVTASTDADIVSDLLKKSFSARQSGEQNIIIKQRPMPNLQATTRDRSFQESWYTKKDWLCGSTEKKAMFCWPCLLFCPGTSSSWTKTGFKNMKGFLSDCKKHEKAKSHMSAYKTWKTYGSGPRVDSLISQGRRDQIQRHNEEVSQNREMLKTITEAVLYLSRQELALRGHDESNESLNRGNYRELLECFAKMDSVFGRRLHGRLAESRLIGSGQFTGVSPDIQNDLINCLDMIIEDEILKEIDDCTFLSVQVDETTDVSTKEQLSMIVRLDKGSDIIERQLGFVDVSSDRTANAISTVVKGKLIQHENIKEKLIGQTYDGASVMSGHLNGVQAQLQQEYPFAHFVHCAAHRLNLVLCQAASSISPVKIFFVNISAFCTFTSNAPRRKALLSSHNLEFPSPGDTRWYYRARVINVLYNNYEELIDIFENLTDNPIGWDDETLNKVTGLLGYLNGFLFCFLVQIFQKILEQSSIVYSILQDKETDFQYGMTRVERFKIFVSSLRTDVKYSEFYDIAVEKVGPPVTRYDQRHNYKQIFFEVLDSIVGMLTERFQDMERFRFLDLVNPRVFKTLEEVPSEKIDLLKEMYGDLFDIPMLVGQLSFIYRDKDFHKDSCGELLKYIFQFNLQASIPEAVKLLKMNGVLSVTSASVERSFSCLKRVKTYLRNTMSQGRLSSLCRISIHKDILSEKEKANTLHEEVVKRNFDDNSLVRLTANDFVDLTQMEYLSVSNNKIIDIEVGTFFYLTSLKTLRLSSNFLRRLPKKIFSQLVSLELLDLSMNRIDKLNDDMFPGLQNLQSLSLRKNVLKSLDDGVISGLENVQYLYLDSNDLSSLGSNVFNGKSMLKVLILKNNALKIVKASWLKNKRNLQVLELQHNNIEEIEAGAFDDLENLVKLDISSNKIQVIPENLFQNLVSLRSLRVDHFTLCCYAKQSHPSVSCVSEVEDGFSSCDELLKNTVLKYSIWILGLMAFFGNLIVIIWRSVSKDSNRVNSFLLSNLAVADFLMGVYMLIIAYKDRVWDGVYFKHDISWRASDLCIFAGVISTASSEVSVLTLTAITLERMVCIVFPFKFRRWSMKRASTIMSFIWILGFCISLIPLVNDEYFYDYDNNVHFFGRSAVCLPFQLSNDRPAGWEYSVLVFLVLNAVSFLFILLSYALMYRTVVKATNSVRSTRVNKDSAIAKRMMFIILTDFFCWFPVIIISILALTGNLYDPSKQVYAWIAVFVLPINSSINPLLYTFSTPYVRDRMPTKKLFSSLSLSTKRRQKLRKAWRKGFSGSSSADSSRDTIQTVDHSSPQSIRMGQCVNKGSPGEPNIAGRSFIDSFPAKDHFIDLMEKRFVDEEKLIQYVAVDEKETPCLVYMYKSENEDLWWSITNLLSWISSEGGHENILPYMWSAKAENVLVETKNCSKNNMLDLEPTDCLICFELSSKKTLASFLREKKKEITEDVVCSIIMDIVQAVDYLSSNDIVHDAIVPENVFLFPSDKFSVERAVLGGFHAARFSIPLIQQSEPGEEEMINQNDSYVESFGKFLKIILDTFPALEKCSKLNDVMALCLNQNGGNKPITLDLLKRLDSLVLCDPPSNDTKL